MAKNARAKLYTLILRGSFAYEGGKYEITEMAVTDFNISYIIELFSRHQGLKRELLVVTKD